MIFPLIKYSRIIGKSTANYVKRKNHHEDSMKWI